MSSKLNEYTNLWKTHTCDVSSMDYERIEPKIDLLRQLAAIEKSLYTVYDMHRKNYLLKSEEQERLFNDSISIPNVPSDIVHPDDLSFKMETEILVYQFYASLPIEQKKNYKLVYDFRVKNKEDIYLRYIHQSIILELDRKGKTWLSLVVSNPLSEKKPSEKPHRRMVNLKTGKLHLFNEIDQYSGNDLLTEREKEILSLIGQGYDSINISDKLCISKNTVNNHRQNILRKTNQENTTQAYFYCKRVGIIL